VTIWKVVLDFFGTKRREFVIYPELLADWTNVAEASGTVSKKYFFVPPILWPASLAPATVGADLIGSNDLCGGGGFSWGSLSGAGFALLVSVVPVFLALVFFAPASLG